MKASEVCHKAGVLVSGDRAATHGDKTENHQNIAALWSAYLWPDGDDSLSPEEVALMMALLKIARTKSGAHNDDDYIDLAGYAGCAGEIAAAKQPQAERHDPIAAFRETWKGGPLYQFVDDTGATILTERDSEKVLLRVEPE